ncbi:hypothetical protein V9K67_21705 [Paraflavisolibacter sp. H34]|uniref:hypothetical protein n=1 Tax=Huijunlia imazamoxiresistens TaxID=3127457 RepID=UPI00301607C2
MAKDLKSGLKSVFSSSLTSSPATATEPEPETVQPESSTQAGLRESYDRETFIIKTELSEKIRDIAYWDRHLLMETVNEALAHFVESWEQKNGPVQSRPPEVKEREKLRSNSGRKKGSANK